MDIPNEALSRYPEDYKTIGGSAMERRAFTAGAEWVRREMEARVVELEAVIQKVRAWASVNGAVVEAISPIAWSRLDSMLSSSPSVVLADHDAAVWDQGYFTAGENWARRTWDDGPQLTNPYRAADQNGEHAKHLILAHPKEAAALRNTEHAIARIPLAEPKETKA